MIIYLAGGFSVMNVQGRERYLYELVQEWNRLVSYVYFKDWGDSTLVLVKEEMNKR